MSEETLLIPGQMYKLKERWDDLSLIIYKDFIYSVTELCSADKPFDINQQIMFIVNTPNNHSTVLYKNKKYSMITTTLMSKFVRVQ